MSWSQIYGTTLCAIGYRWLDFNKTEYGLTYHNKDHILAMYNYLEETNESYNEALDWAVLFHDIVYDSKPDKELRSADYFKEQCSGRSIDPAVIEEAYVMIMATANHVVSDKKHSAIVRADLHALTNPISNMKNFMKILEENVNLYNLSETVLAVKTEEFMHELFKRVSSNIVSDSEHQKFYREVLHGINTTIQMSRFVRGW